MRARRGRIGPRNAILRLSDPRVPDRARNTRIDVGRAGEFVVWRVPKAANSTVLRTLLAHDPALSGDLPADSMRESKKRAYPHPLELDARTVRRAARSAVRAAFVRHPVHRILSTFLDKAVGGKGTADPYLSRLNGEEPDLVGFLRFLADGHLYDDPHWAPQSALIPPVGSLDLVGRVESIDRDLRRAVAMIWPTTPWRGVQSWVPHATDASRRTSELVSPAARELILELYHDDFAVLGYSTEATS